MDHNLFGEAAKQYVEVKKQELEWAIFCDKLIIYPIAFALAAFLVLKLLSCMVWFIDKDRR